MKARLVKTCGKWQKEDWAFMSSFKADGKRSSVNDSLITYMSKGKLAPIHVVGYSEEVIEELRAKWVEFTKPKKPTYSDVIDEVIYNMSESKHPVGDAQITAWLIESLNKHKLVCGRYKIRDMYDTISMRHSPAKYTRQLLESVLIFPLRKEHNNAG